MASGPITPWEIDGKTVETVAEFIFWGSKITADGDCSHEVKRNFLLGRKILTNLNIYFWPFIISHLGEPIPSFANHEPQMKFISRASGINESERGE